MFFVQTRLLQLADIMRSSEGELMCLSLTGDVNFMGALDDYMGKEVGLEPTNIYGGDLEEVKDHVYMVYEKRIVDMNES